MLSVWVMVLLCLMGPRLDSAVISVTTVMFHTCPSWYPMGARLSCTTRIISPVIPGCTVARLWVTCWLL